MPLHMNPPSFIRARGRASVNTAENDTMLPISAPFLPPALFINDKGVARKRPDLPPVLLLIKNFLFNSAPLCSSLSFSQGLTRSIHFFFRSQLSLLFAAQRCRVCSIFSFGWRSSLILMEGDFSLWPLISPTFRSTHQRIFIWKGWVGWLRRWKVATDYAKVASEIFVNETYFDSSSIEIFLEWEAVK